MVSLVYGISAQCVSCGSRMYREIKGEELQVSAAIDITVGRFLEYACSWGFWTGRGGHSLGNIVVERVKGRDEWVQKSEPDGESGTVYTLPLRPEGLHSIALPAEIDFPGNEKSA